MKLRVDGDIGPEFCENRRMSSSVSSAVVAELLRESLAKGQRPQLRITSNSMWPLLRVADRVVLEPAGFPPQCQIGDIITFEGQTQLITHRFWGAIQSQAKDFLITRGDRPLSFDAPSATATLVGKVVIVMRGHKQIDLRTNPGKWLNRRLIWLAKTELTLIAKLTRNPHLQQIPQATPNGFQTYSVGSAIRQNRGLKWLRRLFRGFSWCLVTIVYQFAPTYQSNLSSTT